MTAAPAVVVVRTGHGNFFNNTYVIKSASGQCLLVDPAWQVEPYLDLLAKDRLECVGILVTHYHYDHINLTNRLCVRLGVPAYFSRTESQYYGVEFENAVYVEPHAQIRFDSHSVRAIFTPGHTHGGVCYLVEKHLISGDTLFNEGCGNCVDRGSDPVALFHSIQLLKAEVSEDTQVYPGHSYGTEPGQQMGHLLKHNIYLQLEDSVSFSRFRMRKMPAR